MIHLDTSFLIAATLAGSPAHAQLTAWAAQSEQIGVCAVVWAEYFCGPLDVKAETLARQIFPHPEPLLGGDAMLAAHLFNLSGRRSRTLADCMVAAIAIRCHASLATMNRSDFVRFQSEGLTLT